MGRLEDRVFYEHLKPQDAPDSKPVRVYCCPCCDYPTLSEPGGYEICDLCDWEDDGCDGGGPNICGDVGSFGMRSTGDEGGCVLKEGASIPRIQKARSRERAFCI